MTYEPTLINVTPGSEDSNFSAWIKVNTNIEAIQDEFTTVYTGRDWQNSCLDRDLTAPPALPSEGARYIVYTPATGDWAGHEYDIAEYTEGDWLFISPDEGFCCRVEDENINYVYNGSIWVTEASNTYHNSLAGINDGNCKHLSSDEYADLVTNRTEMVQDIAGGMVESNTETGLALSYDDTTGKITGSVTYGTGSNTACQGNDSRLSDARTPVNHNLVDTTNHPVTGLTTNHVLKATGATTYGFGTIPASSVSDFGEAVADAVGAMISGNTETNISVSYQDDDNTLDFEITSIDGGLIS